MGGEQSQETKEEAETESPGESVDADRSGSTASPDTDTPGELPQCRMGNRKVDNMCFMISCTNWY